MAVNKFQSKQAIQKVDAKLDKEIKNVKASIEKGSTA